MTCCVTRPLCVLFWLLAGSLSEAAAAERLRSNVQAPRAIRTVEPRFPDLLLRQFIYEGEARIVMLVDAEGRLVDWLLRSYSHPDLAREATEALRHWRFEPGVAGGAPVDVRQEIVFSFQASGLVTSMTADEAFNRSMRIGEKRGTVRICPAAELDEPLTPLKRVSPLQPTDAAIAEGRAVVDFFVDDEGRTRMPVVVKADDEAFARCAIEAIYHWRFTVPTRQGKPVTVHAVQSFNFR